MVDGEPVAVDSMVVIVTVAATRKGSHPREASFVVQYYSGLRAMVLYFLGDEYVILGTIRR